MSRPPTPPDALLLITSGCPHCPTVLAGLTELVKAGMIGRLEVVNIGVHPETARRLAVRAVPWLRLGAYELEGLRAPAELRRWAETAGTRAGMAAYVAELLKSGRLDAAIAVMRRDPAELAALTHLLADAQTDLHVRVGIGAIMESFQGDAALEALIPDLVALLQHADAHVRGDAVHYLTLSGSPAAIPHLHAALDDPAAQVRELAADGLAAMERRAQPGG
jgi:HEAT repeats